MPSLRMSAAEPEEEEEEEERSHIISEDEENGDGGGEDDDDGGLPEDQEFEVLTRVPLDDLPACRMVSTRWRRLTYEPAFAPLHCRRAPAVSGYLVQSMTHNRYHADFVTMHEHGDDGSPAAAMISLDFLPFAHVRVEAVAAQRGLACCVDVDTSRYYVCKMATRQWRALPNPRVRFRTVAVAIEARPSAAGNAAEFKVVRFSMPERMGHRDLVLCEVFDSRRFKWRRAPDVPFCPWSLLHTGPAVRAHGAMHWLRWRDRHTSAEEVFAFDVEAESWRLIRLPREVDEMDDPFARLRIAAVEGRLCLLVLRDDAAAAAAADKEEVLEVWEMASYGEGRWRKKMTASLKSLHDKERSVTVRDLHSPDVAFLDGFYSVMWYDLRKGNKVAEVEVKHRFIHEIFKYESDLISCDIGRAGRSSGPSKTLSPSKF